MLALRYPDLVGMMNVMMVVIVNDETHRGRDIVVKANIFECCKA